MKLRCCSTLLAAAIAVIAGPVLAQPATVRPADAMIPIPHPQPACGCFDLDEDHSTVSLSLFIGGFESVLDGTVCLRLGDLPTIPGRVSVRVTSASFLASECDADQLYPPCPLVLALDTTQLSAGSWNPRSGSIRFDLYLTTPDGGLPVPMPIQLSGRLIGNLLDVQGSNGDIPDGTITLDILARRASVVSEIYFSTEIPFHIAGPTPTAPIIRVSDGDLLSDVRCVVRTNNELTARLGFKPIVPDLGLDAIANADRRVVFFSLEEDQFSETLGTLITDGDVVTSGGRLARTNLQLVDAFLPGLIPVEGFGLDGLEIRRHPSADVVGAGGVFLFSTEIPFYSYALSRLVSDGDILAEGGFIYRTNAQLLANFNPICPADPCPDFGLDGFAVLPSGEIWFSVEEGFTDALLGPISDGDLLSTTGRIVRANLQLLNTCAPLEDLNNFGLDGIDVRVRVLPCVLPIDPADITPAEPVIAGPAGPMLIGR